MTPEAFGEQLEWLNDRGYRAITFTEAVLGTTTEKLVAITFDDAYASTVQFARPILDRFGMRATLFVPTDYIGGGAMAWPGIDEWVGTGHEQELTPMSWDDTRELADAGWEIGSHTKSHPHLTELTDAEMDEELAGSRRVCEEMLDRPCSSLAYPYGDYDARVVGATRRAEYVAAASFPSRLLPPEPLAWPRVGIFHGDTSRMFHIKASPTVRRIRRSPFWDPMIAPLRKLTGRSQN